MKSVLKLLLSAGLLLSALVAQAEPDVVRLGNLKFAHYGAVSYMKEIAPKYNLKVEERLFAKGLDIIPGILAGEIDFFKDTSFGISYIDRTWHNIIGPVDRAAEYEAFEYEFDDPLLSGTWTLYERTMDTVEENDWLITHLSTSYPYVLQNPYRKYKGLELLFNKRFSNRWQLLASYVYSKATGNVDNGFADDIGYGGDRYDPNYWLNADGKSTFDPTHMVKLPGSYILPLDISFNAYFRAISGNNWTPRIRTGQYNQGRITFLAAPRGSGQAFLPGRSISAIRRADSSRPACPTGLAPVTTRQSLASE